MKCLLRHLGISFLVVCVVPYSSLIPVSYGSDTAVSIVNPFNIVGQDNIINTFGCVKNGFALVDPSTTCSFNSIFPVAGPIYLRGGNLFLKSDLILTNTGTLADLGSIQGGNHVVEFSQYMVNLMAGTQPNGRLVLNLVGAGTVTRTPRSVDWSYDGQYLAVTIASGAGNDLLIYRFDGAALTLVAGVNLAGAGYSVRWHPSSYYLAVTMGTAATKIQLFLFSAPSTLTAKGSVAPTGTFYAVGWQRRGDYIVVAGNNGSGQGTVIKYAFNQGTEAFDSAYTVTNAGSALNGIPQYEGVCWAPRGNKDDVIVVTNNGGTTGSMHLYNLDIAGNLNHLKNYVLSKAANAVDWCATSTYIAVGCADGTLRAYQHEEATNTMVQKQTYTTTGAINSISWKADATELAVARAVASTYEFQVCSFDDSTYALVTTYPIALSTDAYAVRYYFGANSYIARIENSTRLLSVYKESYSPFIFKDVNVRITNDLTLGVPLTFLGNCTINGQHNRITFTGDGTFNVAPNSSLEVRMATLGVTAPSAFALQGRASALSLRDSEIMLDNDMYITTGSFCVYGDLTITGNHQFILETNCTSTIHTNATLAVKDGATLTLGKKSETSPEPITFEDSSSSLVLDNATLHVTNSGFTITKGLVDVYNRSVITVDYTDTTVSITTQALRFGDGINIANDALIRLNGSATELALENGSIIFDACVTPTMIQFEGQAQLAVEATTSLYFKRPIVFKDGWFRPALSFMFVIEPGSYWNFDNTRIDYKEIASDYVLTATIARKGYFLFDDNGKIVLNNGIVYNNLIIDGSNVLFTGNGQLPGNLVFMEDDATVTWDLMSYAVNSVSLNGQKIAFTKNSGFSDGYTFIGTGTIDIGRQEFEFGREGLMWDNNLYWIGDNGLLRLNNDVTLSGIWTFSGSIVIDGQHHCIDFDQTGSIVLERGAHVTFQNVGLHNVSRKNPITCSDNTCEIICNGADILLNGDYLFDKGGIFFAYDSSIGVLDGFDEIYTFSYASTKTSTIGSFCSLRVLENAKFSIGRRDSTVTAPEKQPLIFVDSTTSKLVLSGGTLHITSSGMLLTRGSLDVSDASDIEVETPKYEYGLILGDGTDVNDFMLDIGPGVQLTFKTGSVFSQNYQQDCIRFRSPVSSLDVQSESGFVAKTDITLKNGTIVTENASGVAITTDAGVTAAQENIIRTYMHPATYSVQKRSVHSLRPYKLLDGDFFYILEGFNSSNDVIATAGRSNFGGTGGFGGSLTLKDHTVTLQSSMMTPLFSNVTLNGGTYDFVSDGAFATDKTFTGSGHIRFMGTKVSFGPDETTMTSTLYLQGLMSGEVDLHSKTSLSGTWTFGGRMQLNGNGNILDLNNRGVLAIRPGATLSLENIGIKGLGTGKGNINFMSDTSTLKLSNVYLELDDNFSTTIGGIVVNGPTIVGVKNYNWTLDQNASMTVDGVTLWQDPLDVINYGGIKFGSGSEHNFLSLVSNGTIKTASNLDIITTSTCWIQEQLDTIDHGPLDVAITTTSHYFEYDIFLSFDHMMTITSNTVIDGKGHTIYLAHGASGIIQISDDCRVTFRNIVFENYDDSVFLLGSNATVVFGNGTHLGLLKPQKITMPWMCQGEVAMYGDKTKVTINPLDEIVVLPHSTLSLHEIELCGLKQNNMRCSGLTSAIVLSDSILHIDNDFSFTSGSMMCEQEVMLTGSMTFDYASDSALTVTSDSRLRLEGLSFSYNPSIAHRGLFALRDRSSILSLEGCTLSSSSTGMQLTKGTLMVDHKNLLFNDGVSLSEGFIFGNGNVDDNLNIQMKPGGSFDLVTGCIDYQNSDLNPA